MKQLYCLESNYNFFLAVLYMHFKYTFYGIFPFQIDDPFEGRVVDLSNIHLITTTDHQQISSLISEEEEPQL